MQALPQNGFHRLLIGWQAGDAKQICQCGRPDAAPARSAMEYGEFARRATAKAFGQARGDFVEQGLQGSGSRLVLAIRIRLDAGNRGIIAADQFGYAFEFSVVYGGHHHVDAPLERWTVERLQTRGAVGHALQDEEDLRPRRLR